MSVVPGWELSRVARGWCSHGHSVCSLAVAGQALWKRWAVGLAMPFYSQRGSGRTVRWRRRLCPYLSTSSTFSGGLCGATEAGRYPCIVCGLPHSCLFWCGVFIWRTLLRLLDVGRDLGNLSHCVTGTTRRQPTASCFVEEISLTLRSSLYRPGFYFSLHCPL